MYHTAMPGLFDGTPLERPVTCDACEKPLAACTCPRGAGGEIVLPKDQPARVGCERRRGKTVTIISGLDPVATDMRAMLNRLKTACAAGGAINEGRIEVQGDHRERTVAFLRELGYPARQLGH